MEDRMNAIQLVKETICDKEVPTDILVALTITLIKLIEDIRTESEKIRLSFNRAMNVEDLVSKTLQYVTVVEQGNLFVSILETIGDELKDRQKQKMPSSFS